MIISLSQRKGPGILQPKPKSTCGHVIVERLFFSHTNSPWVTELLGNPSRCGTCHDTDFFPPWSPLCIRRLATSLSWRELYTFLQTDSSIHDLHPRGLGRLTWCVWRVVLIRALFCINKHARRLLTKNTVLYANCSEKKFGSGFVSRRSRWNYSEKKMTRFLSHSCVSESFFCGFGWVCRVLTNNLFESTYWIHQYTEVVHKIPCVWGVGV